MPFSDDAFRQWQIVHIAAGFMGDMMALSDPAERQTRMAVLHVLMEGRTHPWLTEVNP